MARGRAAAIALLVALAAAIGMVAALVASAQPSGASEPTEAVAVYDTAATSVIPDLPKGWGSFTCHEWDGRTWLVVTSPQGGVAVVPYLDDDGTQHVVSEGN